jgi:hypothetical protein
VKTNQGITFYRQVIVVGSEMKFVSALIVLRCAHWKFWQHGYDSSSRQAMLPSIRK